eukprot:g2508.t1
MQLDTFVALDQLEDASYELDKFIQSARAQLFEIRKKKGTKNVKFMLSLFMDDCKLRILHELKHSMPQVLLCSFAFPSSASMSSRSPEAANC